MALVNRVLDDAACTSLDEHLSRGGGEGLKAARRLGGPAVVEEIEASGLRGRGGAGFPTGTKWRTVTENRVPGRPLAVVVNAAEGEPGSFKDRAILRRNPYRVVEGALCAAVAVGADEVVVATKAAFATEVEALRRAMSEVEAAGWLSDVAPDGDVALRLVTGPSAYLFGEETGLLEVVAGRPPFPRVAPPFRRGIDADDGSGAEAHLTGPNEPGEGEPVLVNNVETMAHAAMILGRGADWFRELGTPESPGTVVVTISGDVDHAGVGEVPMGTPLSEAISAIGGGPREGRSFVAALSGVANPFLPADRFDTPLTYEDMVAAGTGIGAAGFLLFDESADLVAVAQGVSRFLSVESCGQCTPCKQDGLAITGILDEVRTGTATDATMTTLGEKLATVTDGARCFLANQHQAVVDSLLVTFPDAIRTDLDRAGASEPVQIAAIADIVEGKVVLDPSQADKQPDWTHDPVDSGRSPADRIDTLAAAPR